MFLRHRRFSIKAQYGDFINATEQKCKEFETLADRREKAKQRLEKISEKAIKADKRKSKANKNKKRLSKFIKFVVIFGVLAVGVFALLKFGLKII